MSSFHVRLKELRLEEHLTQAELAAIIGISKSTISMYENGNREPDFETLESFADYFNVDMNYLTGYTDDPVDYDNYDGYIPEQFNGDVKRFFEFQKAVDQDAMEEQREFDTFLQSVLPSERDHIEKYRSLDAHGKEMVDFTLQKEWERSTVAQKITPIKTKESTQGYLAPQAAHNDYIDEPGELEKMRDDLAKLKRPDAGK